MKIFNKLRNEGRAPASVYIINSVLGTLSHTEVFYLSLLKCTAKKECSVRQSVIKCYFVTLLKCTAKKECSVRQSVIKCYFVTTESLSS